jgi:hypothetical protein
VPWISGLAPAQRGVLFVVGFTVQAGATGAVKAIKMSAKLLPGRTP